MYEKYPPFYPWTSDNRAAIVVIAAVLSLIYAILALAIKFFIRLNITSIKDFDVVLFVGNILYVVQTTCVVVACNHGLSQHRSAISQGEFDTASKAIYASHILAVLVFGCAKLSVCLLIRQLSNHGWMRKAIFSLTGLVALWILSGALVTAFQCPLPKPWDSEGCPATRRVYIYNSIMNIITDVALCVLPIAMMLEVQTTAQRKVVVTLLFGSRIVTTAVTIPSLIQFESVSDSTWSAVPSTSWFQLSLGLSIITACIPSLKSVIDSYLGGTGRATVGGAYNLTRSGNESGLAAIRVHDDSQQETRGSATDGNKATTARSKRATLRKDNIARKVEEENESVEGLTTAREGSDRETASRGASQGHSRASSIAEFNG